MRLDIEQRESQGVVIPDLKGPLASGGGDLALREVLPALRQSGRVDIMLAGAFEFFEDQRDAVNSFFPDRALKRYEILDFVRHEDDRKSNRAIACEAVC